MVLAGTLPTNVRDDGISLVATAKVGRNRRRRKRFPYGTPPATMTAWIDGTRRLLRVNDGQREPARRAAPPLEAVREIVRRLETDLQALRTILEEMERA
jgi:hypothetical protein